MSVTQYKVMPMPLRTGLYKVEFTTQIGAGVGVVVLDQGRLRGGDIAIAYLGTYTEDGDSFSADVQTLRHSSPPGVVSVFGNDDLLVQLKGASSGTTINLEGSSHAAPGVTFKAVLTHLGD